MVQDQGTIEEELLKAFIALGHNPVLTAHNEMTGYLEARCTACNARGWGWYFGGNPMRPSDLEGPGVTTPCPRPS
jgi:hypothetical protein